MLRVGLTGGISTGKSYCLDRFSQMGAQTIDADVLARTAVAPGSPGRDAVLRRFGLGVVGPDGQLDRAALGRVVFEDAAARHDLEAIIHPVVYEGISRWLASLSDGDGRTIAVADIPLLFETQHDQDFDAVVVTACTPDRQLARLTGRGLSRDEAERRIAAQMPLEEKVRRADYVIDTSGTFDDTDTQINQVWKALTARAAAPR